MACPLDLGQDNLMNLINWLHHQQTEVSRPCPSCQVSGLTFSWITSDEEIFGSRCYCAIELSNVLKKVFKLCNKMAPIRICISFKGVIPKTI